MRKIQGKTGSEDSTKCKNWNKLLIAFLQETIKNKQL